MELKNNEMERLYAETFHSVKEGKILEGKILALKHDGVIVDIGYKSEGVIPIGEFSEEEAAGLKPGTTIEVYIEHIRDSDGTITLSKERATKIKVWETLENALQEGIPVEGKIVCKIKGGFSVNISGVQAFLPGSQVDIKTLKEIDSLIGKKLLFKVIKLNSKVSNIIISRRVILEEERQKKKAETVEKIKEGELIKGVVKNITDYGVFVDLGGLDGLLHISDISWGRINHPSEFFALGDEIEVIVIKFIPRILIPTSITIRKTRRLHSGTNRNGLIRGRLLMRNTLLAKKCGERLLASLTTALLSNLKKGSRASCIYPK